MTKGVNSFFLTKIAEDDEIIDPGEAAAAGLAIAGGPVAQKVIPTLGGFLARATGPKPVRWTGSSIYGLERLGDVEEIAALERGLTPRQLEASMKLPPQQRIQALAEQYKPPTKKLLGLFDIGQKAAPGLVVKPTEHAALYEGYESINSMIEKNKLTRKGVKMDITSGPVSRVLGPSYDPTTKRVKLPWVNKEFALHEIGHAAHLTEPGAKSLHSVRKLLNRGAVMSIPIAYLAGNELQKMLPGTIDDKVIGFIQENAPAIMAATWAGAEVYPEVQATTRAVKHVYKTEGAKAAAKTLKRLLPALSTYVIPIVPALVGVSLAKKYYFEAKKKELEKEGGILDAIWKEVAPIGEQISHIGGQVAQQTSSYMSKPIGEVGSALWNATKHTIKSPEFATGAAMAAIPAATFAYVYHNTPHGKVYREKLQEHRRKHGVVTPPEIDLQRIRDKAKDDSVTFPAIVGITAALSGGILNKMFSDIMRVL